MSLNTRLWLNAVLRHMRRWSITPWIMLSSAPSHASIRRYIKSFTSCTSVLWTRCWIMPQILLLIGLRSGLFSGHKSGSLYGLPRSLRLLHFLEWRQRMMNKRFGKTTCRKDHSQKNLSKPILWYRNVYNEIASDVWERIILFIRSRRTSHLPQPVLINVLIIAIFEH